MCVGIIGPVLSAAGSVFGAIQQSQQQKAQAKVYQNQAKIERDKSRLEAGRIRRTGTRVTGAQRNLFLAQGIALEGTPEDVIYDSVAQNEFDARIAEYGGEVNAQNFETQARLLRSSAKGTLYGGFIGALTPFVNAARQGVTLGSAFS